MCTNVCWLLMGVETGDSRIVLFDIEALCLKFAYQSVHLFMLVFMGLSMSQTSNNKSKTTHISRHWHCYWSGFMTTRKAIQFSYPSICIESCFTINMFTHMFLACLVNACPKAESVLSAFSVLVSRVSMLITNNKM